MTVLRSSFPRVFPTRNTTLLLDEVTCTTSCLGFSITVDSWRPQTNDTARQARSASTGWASPRIGHPEPTALHTALRSASERLAAYDRTTAERQIKLGISRPIPSSGTRSIKSKGEPTRDLNKALSRSGARYVLKTDVQRFYPSIYTHSIPWALHGKAVAKTNRSSSLVGNVIDKAVRDAQDGQTIGVPIGPDTSAIVAECLMAAVERDLIAQVGALNGWRYTDDIELAFSTIGEAEKGLSALMEVLAGYELSLSPAKTSILELPEALGKRAIRDFRDFAFRDTEAKQR